MMVNIVDIIVNEFSKADYSVIARIDESNALILKHKIHIDYWVVTNQFDLENQSEFFSKYKSAIDHSTTLDKNTTLLYLREADDCEDVVRNESMMIEEDSFVFKKFVLNYKEEDFKGLVNIFSEEVLLGGILPLLMNKNNFENLKKESIGGPMTLLYSMAHKLPFVFMLVDKTYYNSDENLTYTTPDACEIDNLAKSLPVLEKTWGRVSDDEKQPYYEFVNFIINQ